MISCTARFLTGLLFIFLSSVCASKQAELLQPTVHFAGLVFTGSYQQLEDNYPNTLALNNKGQLDVALYEYLKTQKSPHFKLKYGLANLNKGESLVLAVALDREFVNRETYLFGDEKNTRIIADVSVQILLIDFESLVIEAAYPLSFALNDVLDGDVNVTEEYESALFRRLYFGDRPLEGANLEEPPLEPSSNEQQDKTNHETSPLHALSNGFLKDMADLSLSVRPDKLNRTRVSVREVKISDTAAKDLPKTRTKEQLAHFIGSTFTANMAKEFGVQVIPYSRDYAITGQMAARFSNGEVYQLKLPIPNFILDVELLKFKKLQLDNLVYSSFFNISLKSAAQGHVYFEDSFRGWTSKYKGQSIEDWPAYEDSMEVLLLDLSKQLVHPSRTWFNEHARNGTDTFNRSKKTREYFTHED